MTTSFKAKIVKTDLNLYVDYDDSLLLSDEVEIEDNVMFDVDNYIKNHA